MLTKADFQKLIRDTIADYPAIAPLYHAGDPRITQHLDAMATMLGALSAQIEVAQIEPFEKTRDSTVMADAAMRGIVRKATPARVLVRARNAGSSPFLIESGTAVLDSSGLPYRVETAATVPPGDEATFEASQRRAVTFTHIVNGSEPFYSIPIPPADDEAVLCAVAVSDGDGIYEYRDRYVNTMPEERVYHVEADDQQQVYVRFGFDGVVGVQPKDGAAITLTVFYTAGDVSPDFGSPFAFAYLSSPSEAAVDMKMDALLAAGQNPMPMSVLRDLARYPSIYNGNAVFLGEFDFLVRRTFPTLQFLSVWNEATEEAARGASLDNINALFIACLSSDGGEAIRGEGDSRHPAPAVEIEDADLTATQIAIKAAVRAADDSYRVRFFTPVISRIRMTINATVSTSYIASDVRRKISEALLREYGREASASRRGRTRPRYKRVYALLREKVPALADAGSDLTVSIDEPSGIQIRPEMWRYLDAESLTVNVATANIVIPSWGA
ncbi:hypothetical protein [Burkholderia plantarii]|uniref:Baseplate protein J-like domain-containing protein n=1 Tax=Burkholderia plantarii TaxID=41899 RepID=A0A0B6RVS6_BURPL|nr:hypothetical protein [Burkholderia plantarii]AJK46254.1 hypothetical protein BGL_1c17450 [Burkholderia plantarii]